MPTVAEQLRLAREQQHLDIYQVAEITKIRTDHIRALESGQYDCFSAQVYIRGFVRTYARALKLDEVRLAADLDAELSQTEKFSEPPALSGKSSSPLDFIMLQLSKLDWRLVLVLLVLALVLVLGFIGIRYWQHQRTSDPLKNLGPGLYQPHQGQEGALLPLPTNAPLRR